MLLKEVMIALSQGITDRVQVLANSYWFMVVCRETWMVVILNGTFNKPLYINYDPRLHIVEFTALFLNALGILIKAERTGIKRDMVIGTTIEHQFYHKGKTRGRVFAVRALFPRRLFQEKSNKRLGRMGPKPRVAKAINCQDGHIATGLEISDRLLVINSKARCIINNEG